MACNTGEVRGATSQNMHATQHSNIVSFIWGIADRDLYVRGKCDVILPIVVPRRVHTVTQRRKALDGVSTTGTRSSR